MCECVCACAHVRVHVRKPIFSLCQQLCTPHPVQKHIFISTEGAKNLHSIY